MAAEARLRDPFQQMLEIVWRRVPLAELGSGVEVGFELQNPLQGQGRLWPAELAQGRSLQ